jgi:hypothetical protein
MLPVPIQSTFIIFTQALRMGESGDRNREHFKKVTKSLAVNLNT